MKRQRTDIKCIHCVLQLLFMILLTNENKYQISGRGIFEPDQAVSTSYVLNNDLSIFRGKQKLWFISHRKLSLLVRMVKTSKIRSI